MQGGVDGGVAATSREHMRACDETGLHESTGNHGRDDKRRWLAGLPLKAYAQLSVHIALSCMQYSVPSGGDRHDLIIDMNELYLTIVSHK
jgi:hypothetical protein